MMDDFDDAYAVASAWDEANLPAWLEQAAKPDVKVDEQAYDDWLQNLDWRPR